MCLLCTSHTTHGLMIYLASLSPLIDLHVALTLIHTAPINGFSFPFCWSLFHHHLRDGFRKHRWYNPRATERHVWMHTTRISSKTHTEIFIKRPRIRRRRLIGNCGFFSIKQWILRSLRTPNRISMFKKKPKWKSHPRYIIQRTRRVVLADECIQY